MPLLEAKLIAHQFVEEIWNRGNISLIDEMLSDTCSYRLGSARKPFDATIEPLKTCISNVRRAFPDLQISEHDAIAEENKIAIRWTAKGTHEAEFQGLVASGREFTLSGVVILIIENKKICSVWISTNLCELMAQLNSE